MSSMTLEVRRYLNEDGRCKMQAVFLNMQYVFALAICVLELANCFLEHMVYVVLELNVHMLLWNLMYTLCFGN